MTEEPRTSLEIERKYEVSAETALPDLSQVRGVQRVIPMPAVRLTAAYFDTENLALAQSGRALRLREGGHDAGWHLKHRTAEGMLETHWDAQRDAAGILNSDIPEQVLRYLEGITRGDELRPIALIQTQRSLTTVVFDGHEGAIVEIADDEVNTVDVRTEVRRSWREWEAELLVELAPETATVVMDALEEVLVAAGAQPSTIDAKLQRALGQDPVPE